MRYNARKAAETIAYFIIKSGNHQINVLKAIKLVYLADRESLKQYGHPIQDEDRVSMPHGPVNSMTLDRINLPSELMRSLNMEDGWHTILTDRKNYGVGLVNPNLSADDFDELSLADIEVLDRVWEQFGNMSEFDLSNWTHNPQNVPEWENPNGSTKPISLLSMMTAVGIENPEQQAESLKESEEIDSFFERL